MFFYYFVNILFSFVSIFLGLTFILSYIEKIMFFSLFEGNFITILLKLFLYKPKKIVIMIDKQLFLYFKKYLIFLINLKTKNEWFFQILRNGLLLINDTR